MTQFEKHKSRTGWQKYVLESRRIGKQLWREDHFQTKIQPWQVVDILDM